MFKRGQLSTIDLIGSIAIYVILLIFIIVYWNLYEKRFDANINEEEMAVSAIKISDFLVENSGFPTNWNNSNVQIIGLVSKDRILETRKLQSFINTTYNKTRNLWNIENYQYHLRITDLNGALLNVSGNFTDFGPFQNADEDLVLKVRRFALYGGKKVIVEFSLWK